MQELSIESIVRGSSLMLEKIFGYPRRLMESDGKYYATCSFSSNGTQTHAYQIWGLFVSGDVHFINGRSTRSHLRNIPSI